MSLLKKTFLHVARFLKIKKDQQAKSIPQEEEEACAYLNLTETYVRQGRHTDAVATLCSNVRVPSCTAVIAAGAMSVLCAHPDKRETHAKRLWATIERLSLHHRAQVLSGDFTIAALCQAGMDARVWGTLEQLNWVEKADVLSGPLAISALIGTDDTRQSATRAAHMLNFVLGLPPRSQVKILSAPMALLALGKFDEDDHLVRMISNNMTFHQQCTIIDATAERAHNGELTKGASLRYLGHDALVDAIDSARPVPALLRKAQGYVRDPRVN